MDINKTKLRPAVLAAIAISLISTSFTRNWKLTDYVNPFVGTDGHGHTYPGAIVPFGMIQPSPDTRLEGWDGCGGYHYSDDTIYGFSQTHLSGTGVEDLCDILLMPVNAKFSFNGRIIDRKDYRSHFSHRREIARPGYYRVHLDRIATDVELTCDRRRAAHRYRYDKTDGNGFIIDLRHRDKLLAGGIAVHNGVITGYRESASWSPDQKIFFAIESNVAFKSVEIVGDSTQAIIRFADGTKEATLWVAISAVDRRGATNNLHAAKRLQFDKMRKAADSVWNSELSKIKVEGGTKEQRRCFYTALYHCMTAPYLFSDADGRYRGLDGKIHQTDGRHDIYTVFSLWDTYRALHPLLTIIDRKRTDDFIYTILKHYEQGGETTMWELAAYETHCMIGYHAAPVVLEAATAGVLDTWPDSCKTKLLEGLVATSNLQKYGRADYAHQGYLGSETDNESVSKTLEYAYDDWCIAQYAAKIAPIKQDGTLSGDVYNTYIRRSQSWKNIMDENGFMHPRRNGGFLTPFNPTEINNNYTEGNSWQYSTYVPHDVYGWIERIGGRTTAGQFLDSLFYGKSELSGRDQADVTGLIGQYAHGNEPSHHAAYLFTYIGRPQNTQRLVNQVLNSLYTSKPDGLCGNEDCGQMSAWYVLSAIGFYPVCPGSGEYVTTTPLFKKITISADNKPMVIAASDWQPGKFWRGGVFYDTSVSKADPHVLITVTPCFDGWSQRFDSTRTVRLTAENADIYYTLDGSKPDTASKRYTNPIVLNQDAVINAVAYNPATGYSNIVAQRLTHFVSDKRLTYITRPDPQYYENGEEGLVDNLYGSVNYRIGGWQGWTGDMEVVIDLLAQRQISTVGASCLEDTRSWIFYPSAVEVTVSDDGSSYRPFAQGATGYIPVADAAGTNGTGLFAVHGNDRARYVRLKISNFGKLPSWHVSAGQQAWLFIDEVVVK